jgi:hypothetical protein
VLTQVAVFEIFGNYPSTATVAEKTLSLTMQAIVGNFARNPAAAPAPNWPKYIPGNTTTLAKLAYNSNVALSNVVQAVRSNSLVRTYSPPLYNCIDDSPHRIHHARLCGTYFSMSDSNSLILNVLSCILKKHTFTKRKKETYVISTSSLRCTSHPDLNFTAGQSATYQKRSIIRSWWHTTPRNHRRFGLQNSDRIG